MLDRLIGRLRHRTSAGAAAAPESSWLEVFDRIPSGVLILDAEGCIRYVNLIAARLLGRPAPALIGTTYAHPMTSSAAIEIDTEEGQTSKRILAVDVVDIRWMGSSARLATLQDVTEQRRLESLKSERVKLLERMAQGASLHDVLTAIVHFVESQYPQAICTVMLLDPDGRRLHHGASTHLPHALIDAYEGAEIGPYSGSCGTAAFERRTVIVADIASDPLWVNWRELALQNGIHACWSMPIFSSTDHVVGTFAIYYRTTHQPAEDELELASTCAHITGIAIERHRAEEQLSLLQTSVAHLNDLVIITESAPLDEPGPRIVFVNDTFSKRTGYARHEVLGRSPRLLQGPLTSRAELDRIRKALDANQPIRAELVNYTKAGLPFWLELDISPITGVQGDVTHFVSVERDITEFKRAEAAARQNEELFRTIAKVTTDAIWDWNLGDDALWWSDGFQTLFGYAPSEIEPGIESWTSRLHPDERQRVLSGIHGVIDGGGERWSDEYRFLRKNGTYADVLDRGIVIRDAAGVALRMVGGMNDVSARKQSEVDAQRLAQIQTLIIQTQREIAESDLDIEAVMDLLAQRAQEMTGAQGAAMLSVDDGAMVYVAVAGSASMHRGLRLAREHSLAGAAARERKALICDDAEMDPRVDLKACRAIGLRSLLCAPLLVREEVIAVLSVNADHPHAFTRADAANVQILLDALGSVVVRMRAADVLRASEAQYRLLFDQNPQPMWVFERSSAAILAVNAAAIEHYGYSRSEFLKMTIWDLRPEDEIERLAARIHDLPVGHLHAGKWKHRRKNGSLIDVEIASDDITFEGRPARLVLAHDVTARMEAERELGNIARAQRMLSNCNEALTRIDTEQGLLEAICGIVVQEGGYRLAWVGYAQDDDSRSITPMASAGDAIGYLEGIQVSWSEDRPEGRGLAGRTIRSGQPGVSNDIAHDASFQPWVAAARQYGLRTTACLPLQSPERTFGQLSLYASQLRPIGSEELTLLKRLADNLAYGIRSLRSRNDRRRLHAAITKVATAVSFGVDAAVFNRLALAMAEAVDADAAFIARFLPGEPLTARTVSAVVEGQVQANFDYTLEGTPCENFIQEIECVVPDHVATRFPRSASLIRLGAKSYVGRRFDRADGVPKGLLFVIFRRPLQQDSAFIRSALSIFAARAAAEFERQDTDQRLREQASLLDKAQNAIVARDLEQRITYWNKGAEHLYGWTFEEVRGRTNIENAYQDPSAFEAIMASILRDGEWNGRAQHKRKDGRPITVELHATLIRDDQGQPRCTFAIINDITQRLALEERIERSERLESIGQLTGGVAHDFNNLLTVMLGNAEILVEQLHAQPRLQALAEMTRTAAQRGAELTHRLLAFARHQALEPKAVRVNTLIMELDALLRRTLGAELELEIIQGAGLWDALVDPAQLENALLNLCLNGRDAMPEGGRLTIETDNLWIDQAYADQHNDVRPGQYVLIAISDTGSGIAPEQLERVFEPFFTTKPFGKGTGLGLSMVYGFVKQSQGHIKIYSERGEGTTVKMYLPRAGAHEAPKAAMPAPPQDLRGTETILLVEDNELVSRFACDQLQDLGYTVITARSGAEALECVRQTASIDLLFTDVIMPGGINGRQLAEAAKRLLPTLRVLYTSGYTENAIIHHGRLDPGVHLLGKPYAPVDLARKVRAALSEHPS